MAAAEQDQGFVKAIALRAVGVSMGFVFFSAAWRRFFNAPAKLDIDSPKDVANKLVEAAPGSPIAPAIHWLLDRPQLTEWATLLMSVAEAAVGIGLIAGLFTRFAALGSALLNLALMLMFGWMGFDCLDEWTMSALGFAISVAVMLYGPSSYSFDALTGIDPLRSLFTRQVALALTVLTVVFTVGFYEYYFGLLDLHRRTAIAEYHLVAETVPGDPNATSLYVDAGSSAGAAYLSSITFKLGGGQEVTVPADKLQVLRRHFAPWSQSGYLVQGLMKLRLGSKTDIGIPDGAVSAIAHLVATPDQVLTLR